MFSFVNMNLVLDVDSALDVLLVWKILHPDGSLCWLLPFCHSDLSAYVTSQQR